MSAKGGGTRWQNDISGFLVSLIFKSYARNSRSSQMREIVYENTAKFHVSPYLHDCRYIVHEGFLALNNLVLFYGESTPKHKHKELRLFSIKSNLQNCLLLYLNQYEMLQISWNCHIHLNIPYCIRYVAKEPK